MSRTNIFAPWPMMAGLGGVVLATALALGGCSSSTPAVTPAASETAAPATPTTTTTRAAPISASSSLTATSAPDVVSLVDGDHAAFRTPTGNITCLMMAVSSSNEAYVRCDIGQFTWSPPPKPADCNLDWGQTIGLGQTADFGCAGDSVSGEAVLDLKDPPAWYLPPYDGTVTADGMENVTLGYGRALVLGAMRCASAREGVTCLNTATGASFTLSRGRYALVPATHPNATMTTGPDIADVMAGTWDGHGRHLVVHDDGTIEIDFRADVDCSDNQRQAPCDAVIGNLLAYGGSLVLRLQSVYRGAGSTATADAVVTSSSDPSVRVGSIQHFELKDGIVDWSGKTFCGPTPGSQGLCGA